ncbi:MAG: hypothetical protein IJT13_01505 [Bacteroidaceae bacterium]|nr:hypothetical protein [Bacteroidaceae bacterium]
MRRKLLEEMYDRMTPEEKHTFVMLTMQNKNHEEILEALKKQHEQISQVANKVEKQSWFLDFGSDVAANFFTDSLIWIGRKLFRRI